MIVKYVAKLLNHNLVDTDDSIVKESGVLLQLEESLMVEESSTEQTMNLSVPDDSLVEVTDTRDTTEDVSTTQSELIHIF